MPISQKIKRRQFFHKKGGKAMSHKLCNEVLNCGMNDCPSFNNRDNDKCWLTPSTLCKDPTTGDRRPKSIMEKKNSVLVPANTMHIEGI